MREILFRGKRTDNGEWVYGDLSHWEGDDGPVWIRGWKDDETFEVHRVDPATIGEYTVLTDSKKNRIFEGDVVKCYDRNSKAGFTAVVEFGNPNCEYSWGWNLRHISGDEFNMDILLWVDMEETGAFCEVIGNIHDNKDLPEVEHGEN